MTVNFLLLIFQSVPYVQKFYLKVWQLFDLHQSFDLGWVKVEITIMASPKPSVTILGRLQRIQNSAARLVTRTCSHESVSPILHTLHWLPVKVRLVFKLLIIAYKCQHQLAPHYLQQLLQEYQPSRLLRSSTKQLLTPHNVVTKSYGQRSFQYSMPHLWNQLPDDIRECSSLDQFKSLLKSHLFVK